MAKTHTPTEPKTGKKDAKSILAKLLPLALVLGGFALVASPVSADTINWTMITGLIDGMASNLLPSMVTLVTSAVPLLITLAIVGFVMAFLDRILDMLKLTR